MNAGIRAALMAGANKSLGLEICRLTQMSCTVLPSTCYTSRGKEAFEKLKSKDIRAEECAVPFNRLIMNFLHQ